MFALFFIACADKSDVAPLDSNINDTEIVVESGVSSEGGWVDVQAGYEFTCGLRSDGQIDCWSCFNANETDGLAASCEPPIGSFEKMSIGSWAGCAVGQSSELSCWGYFVETGQTIPPSSMSNVSNFDVDGYSYCGLIGTANTVECVGGQTGDELNYTIPISDYTVNDFVVGYYHVAILTEDGEVFYKPMHSEEGWEEHIGQFTQISADNRDFCAVDTDKNVSCWRYGSEASPIGAATTIVDFIDVGLGFACSINSAGEASCWGDVDDKYIKVLDPPKDSLFKQVSAGATHACGVRLDGHIECWGYSINGAISPP